MTKVDGNYILAGRSNMKRVVFPNNDAAIEIKDDTLLGCYNLECATFGAKSYAGPGGTNTSYNSEQLFKDVSYDYFFVEGPGVCQDKSTKAAPRIKTWKAVTAVSGSEGVPYEYETKDGETRVEIPVEG